MIYGLFAACAFIGSALVLTHLVYGRHPGTARLLRLWLLTGALLTALVAVREPQHSLALSVTNVATYLFLTELYLFIYSATLGSLSFRIVVEMLAHEPSAAALEQTLQRCSPDVFLTMRLESLLAQGLLVQHQGRFLVTKRGQRWAMVGAVLKRLLAVGRGG